MPVCSTTRVKSAIVFSLMIDGSGSRGCRIFGMLRPVRMVRRGAMSHQSAARTGWQIDSLPGPPLLARAIDRQGRDHGAPGLRGHHRPRWALSHQHG
jgi:hypothetical protein